MSQAKKYIMHIYLMDFLGRQAQLQAKRAGLVVKEKGMTI